MVTRRQLLAAGLDDTDIAYRVRTSRLIRVHRGVYAVGHLPPSPHARAMAAVPACGPDAVLSHRSAAAAWGLMAHPARVDVTAPGRHRHAGIDAHCSRLAEADITHQFGIPRTTPARTLLDLAEILEDTFLRFVDRYGFPMPEVNAIVAGHEVDMLWRTHRLIAELDGPRGP